MPGIAWYITSRQRECVRAHEMHNRLSCVHAPRTLQILWELLTQEVPYDGMEPFAVSYLVRACVCA